MKKNVRILFIILIIGLLGFIGFKVGKYVKKSNAINGDLHTIVENGDIIFHTSKSLQSKAIQLATNSKYSHVGIIYHINGSPMVYEAVQPVKLTPLDTWINRGVDKKYVVKRLKKASSILDEETIKAMQNIGSLYNGKEYDEHFGWSDDKIYCSELVWKIYQQATGIEIGALQKLSEFDLTSEIVQSKMRERYGVNIPYGEKVISPAAIFESNKLKLVISN